MSRRSPLRTCELFLACYDLLKIHQPHPFLGLRRSVHRSLGFPLQHRLGPDFSMEWLIRHTSRCLPLFVLRLDLGTAPTIARQFEGFAMECTIPDQSFSHACSPVNQPNVRLMIICDCFAMKFAVYSIESTDSGWFGVPGSPWAPTGSASIIFGQTSLCQSLLIL